MLLVPGPAPLNLVLNLIALRGGCLVVLGIVGQYLPQYGWRSWKIVSMEIVVGKYQKEPKARGTVVPLGAWDKAKWQRGPASRKKWLRCWLA